MKQPRKEFCINCRKETYQSNINNYTLACDNCGKTQNVSRLNKNKRADYSNTLYRKRMDRSQKEHKRKSDYAIEEKD